MRDGQLTVNGRPVWVLSTTPLVADGLDVGDLWTDTSVPLVKRCSSTSPVTFVNVEGGGAGAPTDASYVCIGLNASLTAERVLTAGNGIVLTDAGANGNATLSTAIGRTLAMMGG